MRCNKVSYPALYALLQGLWAAWHITRLPVKLTLKCIVFFFFSFLSFLFLLLLQGLTHLEAGHEGAGLVLPPPAGSAALGQDGSDGVLLHRQLSSFSLLQHLAQRVHCTHTVLVFSGVFF